MPYAAVEQAIRTRFAQASASNLGNQISHPNFPALPPTDTRLGGKGPGQDVNLSTILGGRSVAVPVYEYDRQGQDFPQIWPAITYRLRREEFRRENYYPGARVEECVAETSVQNSVTGETKTGALLFKERPHPDPISLFYDLKVWADDSREAKDLLSIVKSLFPARSSNLVIQLRDGCSDCLDMFRTQGPIWEGGLDPTLSEGDPGRRFFAWRMTYEIEAFEDNSLNYELKPTISQRFISVEPKVLVGDPDCVVTFDTPGDL